MSNIIVVRGSLTDATYHYEIPGHGEIIWNVTRAIEHVKAGHCITTAVIDTAEMQNIADRCSWDPAKLDAVDPTIPGISAPIVWEREICYILIDGLHRNARALRDGLPFSAHLLTDSAARDCLIVSPPGLMPW